VTGAPQIRVQQLSPTVSLEIDDGLALICIDNPPVNALSGTVIDGMNLALTEVDDNPDIRLAVLICAGRGFIAGADLKEVADGGRNRSHEAAMMINRIARSTVPIIAAVHGNALGGGFETALACDYRIALNTACFGLPEVKIGAIPGYGGTQRLPRLIGFEHALRMMLSGDPIAAPDALAIGILDEIVEGELRVEALAYARQLIANGAPLRKVDERAVVGIENLERISEEATAWIANNRPGEEAPHLIIHVLHETAQLPIADGLAVERRYSSSRVSAPQCLAMRYLFFAQRSARKNPQVAALLNASAKHGTAGTLAETLNGNPDFELGARLLGAFIREAQTIAAQGVAPSAIDAALVDFGWRQGPFAMLKSAQISAEGTAENGSQARALLDAGALVSRCNGALRRAAAQLLEEEKTLRSEDIDVLCCELYGFPVYRGGPLYEQNAAVKTD